MEIVTSIKLDIKWSSSFSGSNLTWVSSRVSRDLNNVLNCAQIGQDTEV